jgi:hypothetical protein
MRADLQCILEQAHVFIEGPEERFNLSGNVNGTSHPIGGFCFYRNRVADGGFLLLSVGRSFAFAAWPTHGETLYTLTQSCFAVKINGSLFNVFNIQRAVPRE